MSGSGSAGTSNVHSEDPLTGITEPGTVSVPEAARILGITDRAVRKRIAAGTLPARRVDGRWLVQLEDHLDPQTAGTPGTTGTPRVRVRPRSTGTRGTHGTPGVAVPPHETPAVSGLEHLSEIGTPASVPLPNDTRAVPAAGSSPGVTSEHLSDLVRLVRDLQRQNLELAGQVGYLQARLGTAQEQLQLAGPPANRNDPAATQQPEPPRRSLIDRLLRRTPARYSPRPASARERGRG